MQMVGHFLVQFNKLPSISEDVPHVASMYELVLEEARKLSKSDKYKSVKHDLDLVFYITRARASLIKSEEIGVADFSSLWWRSVSCVNAKQGVVLYAELEAPELLRVLSGQVTRNHG